MPNKFYAWLSGIFAFLVEDVERRQADVRNLLFTESDSCAFAFLVEDVERRQAVSDISSSPRVTRLSSPVFEVDVSASPLGTADARRVTMTIQRPPIGPCFDAFVLKFASLGASSTPSPLMLDRWAAFKRATGQALVVMAVTSEPSFGTHANRLQTSPSRVNQLIQGNRSSECPKRLRASSLL